MCVCVSAWACVVVCALLVILCGLSLQAHTDTHIQRDTHTHTCSGTLKIGRQVDALSLSLSAKASSAARSSQAAQKTVESSGEREEWGDGGEQQPEVKSPRQTLEGVAGAEEDFNFELSKRRRSWSKGRQIFLYAGLCVRVCVCVWEMFACLPWQELLRFFICLSRNSFFARSFASTRLSSLSCANCLAFPPHCCTPAWQPTCHVAQFRIVRERRSRLCRHRCLCLRL